MWAGRSRIPGIPGISGISGPLFRTARFPPSLGWPAVQSSFGSATFLRSWNQTLDRRFFGFIIYIGGGILPDPQGRGETRGHIEAGVGERPTGRPPAIRHPSASLSGPFHQTSGGPHFTLPGRPGGHGRGFARKGQFPVAAASRRRHVRFRLWIRAGRFRAYPMLIVDQGPFLPRRDFPCLGPYRGCRDLPCHGPSRRFPDLLHRRPSRRFRVLFRRR